MAGREVLGVGATGEAGRRVSRRALLTLTGLAGVGAAGWAARGGGSPSAALPAAPAAPRSQAPAPVVHELGHPLLGGPAADVFGLVAGGVVRIELAAGRVTLTPLPPMPEGPVSFVPVRAAVLVHCGHLGPVYLVPDGGAARRAPIGFAGVGPLLPGPDPEHVWLVRGPGRPAYLVELDLDGRSTGTAIALPRFTTAPVSADGAGTALVTAVGGAYWAGARGLERVTTGTVVATGPAGWLVVECDDLLACSGILVTRDGVRGRVGGVVGGVVEPGPPAGGLAAPLGTLSPDSRWAAFFAEDRGRVRLVVLDVRSGRRTRTALALVDPETLPTPAWSPDGRRLLTVDEIAQIVAVDRVTGAVAPLLPAAVVSSLPVVRQVLVRPRS